MTKYTADEYELRVATTEARPSHSSSSLWLEQGRGQSEAGPKEKTCRNRVAASRSPRDALGLFGLSERRLSGIRHLLAAGMSSPPSACSSRAP